MTGLTLNNLLATSTILIASVLSPSLAHACSCAALRPPCQAVGESGLVFIGTVSEVTTEGILKVARMKIDRTFKSTLNAEEELFDDGMCDGPTLKPGGQYLIYSDRTATGKIPSRGCTRSRAIEYADEDLKFLNAYAEGKTTTQIRGAVRFAPDVQGENDDPQHWKPLRNVHITLSSDLQPIQSDHRCEG